MAGFYLRILGIVCCGLAMKVYATEYAPFPTCTETHQVDSIAFIQWPRESQGVTTPQAEGWSAYGYQAQSCIPAWIRQRLLHGFVLYTRFNQDSIGYYARYGDAESSTDSGFLWSRFWFTPLGQYDSIFEFEDSISMSNLGAAKSILRRILSPPYEIREEYYRNDAGKLELYLLDSIRMDGNRTTLVTQEDGETYKTTCVDDGRTMTCDSEPIGPVSLIFEQKIWHHSNGRADSVLTYDLQGSLLYTQRFFWSLRETSAITTRKSMKKTGHALNRMQRVKWPYSINGRRINLNR